MTKTDEHSVLRALRAEAAAAERTRLLDLLAAALTAAEAEAGGAKPGNSRGGRRAAGLRDALDVLQPGNEWAYEPGESYATIVGDIDTVDLYSFDPDDEPEVQPVRLVVYDGAVDAVATAFLSLDEADQLGRDLTALVAQIRAARQQRAGAAQTGQAA